MQGDEVSRKIVDEVVDTLVQNLIECIYKIANNIYKELGPNHNESIYHRAMEVEFRNMNVPYDSEVVAPILYNGNYVGYGRADLVIRDILVIELKAIMSKLNYTEESQLYHYMESLRIKNGLLINFPKLKYKNPGKKCSIRIIDL